MSTIAQHFLSPPIGRLSCAKLSPDSGGDFLFKRLRRGDIGVDGRVFYTHHKSSKLGQYWMYANRFRMEKERVRKAQGDLRRQVMSRNPKAGSIVARLLRTTQSSMARRMMGISEVDESLGCSRDELCSHIESRFTEGMTWENMKEWHIDHVKPLSSFNVLDPSERKKANHFSNLQPLWAIDNLKKYNKV